MKNIVSICILSIFLFSCDTGDENRIASGFFEAEELLVSSEVPGKILTMGIQEGDIVQQGQILAIQDTSAIYLSEEKIKATMTALRQKLSSADAQVAVLLEKQEHIENELERVESLLKSNAVPTKQKDDLEAELALVKKQIDATKSNMSTANRAILSELLPLRAQLNIVKNQKEKAIIKAPISGTITQIYARQGELGMPGKPIVKLADLENMEFRMYLTVEQLSNLKIGQKIPVQPVGVGENVYFSGELFWVSQEAEFTPKNILTADEKAQLVYAAKARIKNDGTLKIGMPADYVISNSEDQ